MDLQQITDVKMYPYHHGVLIETPPVLVEGEGSYRSGHLMGNEFHQLELVIAKMKGNIEIGAAYSWHGHADDGALVNSHWVFCTALEPLPTFGVICDWSGPMRISPLIKTADKTLIKLEELVAPTAVFNTPASAYGHAQAELGKSGWLVVSTLVSRGNPGILVESPDLPSSLTQGAHSITITAKSKRTLQSIALDHLYCAEIRKDALFLRQGPAS